MLMSAMSSTSTSTRQNFSSRIPVKLKKKLAVAASSAMDCSKTPFKTIPMPPPPPASKSDEPLRLRPSKHVEDNIKDAHSMATTTPTSKDMDAHNNPVMIDDSFAGTSGTGTERLAEKLTGVQQTPTLTRRKSSCAAFFPEAIPISKKVQEVMMGEPSASLKASPAAVEVKNVEERYPTKILHGPPSSTGQDQSNDEEDQESLPMPIISVVTSNSQSEYQSGGLVIEEVPSDHFNIEDEGGKEVILAEEDLDSLNKLPGKASSLSFKSSHNHNTTTHHFFEKMPAIPEDAPEEVLEESLPPPPKEELRQPSFHTVSSSSMPRPSSSRCIACFNVGPVVKSHPLPAPSKVPVKRMKQISRLPKPARTSRTYEEKFLMKKVLEEKGPAALRSFNPDTISYSPKDGKLTLQREQKAIFTKVVTKTITEYEVDEEGRQRKVRTKKKSNSKSRPTPAPRARASASTSPTPPPSRIEKRPVATSSGLGEAGSQPTTAPTQNKKEDVKPKKVTILEEPTSIIVTSSPPPDDHPNPDSDHDHSGTRSRAENETRVILSREAMIKPFPEKVILLPGHGNPLMELPSVKCPGEGSSLELICTTNNNNRSGSGSRNRASQESRGSDAGGACKRCKVLKNLFSRCEDTVRYLTELLNIKEAELRKMADSMHSTSTSGQPETFSNPFRLAAPLPVNPLFSRAPTPSSVSSGASQFSEMYGNGNSRPRPRFDTDEFIRKFFRFCLLCSDEFLSNSQAIDPFEKMQVFRLCVCMRDCLSNDFMEKMRTGFHELQRRYESLMEKKKSGGNTSWEGEEVQFVLDSYRRFVRYIYYYFKDTLKVIRKFEEETIPIYCTAEAEERRRRKSKYFHDTTMVIDGVQYEGAFIPMKPVSTTESNSNQQ